MSKARKDRRDFLKSSITTAAAMTWAAGHASPAGAQTTPAATATPAAPARPARLKFAAIGLNHGHINGQVDSVKRGGGELVSFYAKEADLAAAFQKRYPEAKLARSEQEADGLDASTDDEVLVADHPLVASELVEDELLLTLPFAPMHPQGACEAGKA